MRKEPVKIKEKEVKARIGNFEEVVLGYAEEEAFLEAGRCLQCKNPTCIAGCPVGMDIKKFIYEITKKDYKAAYFTIREKNDFPSICGRVCPAEYQCRKACVLSKKGSAFASEDVINIHFLERFVGDYGVKNNLEIPIKKEKEFLMVQESIKHFPIPLRKSQKVIAEGDFLEIKVAVVGSGPAGVCCAGELARAGIKVVIFESLHNSGGVLRYGIPPFRLPRDILDYEINYLKKMGVEIIPNHIIGKIKTLDELFSEGFNYIFLGLGAGVPSFLGVEGENLCNIYSANEFLTRINLMSAYKFPEYHTPINTGKHVIVIGGGNTAMDAARCALRMQKISGIAPDTTILYRRSEVEMPARRLEIEHAKEEGIKFEFLVQPTGFIGDEKGFVKKISSLKCRLGELDSSGRRRPVPIEGSDFEMDCDLAVIAIGLQANQVLTRTTPQLKTDKYFNVVVNPETMETSIARVFAGGDIVGGEGTVIEAMGMGKIAAMAIIAQFLFT